MNIIRSLKESIEVMGLPFIYGAQEEVNTVIDSHDLPCVYAFRADQGVVASDNGVLRERLTLVLFFSALSDFDADSVENEDIIEALKTSAFEWYYSRMRPDRQDYGFNVVSLNGTGRVYEQFDDIVTAFAINVTIEEAESVIDFCSLNSPD